MSEKLVDVQNISKIYGNGSNQVNALQDISFSLIAGEIVAIMGPSGCGKSTLLKIVGLMSAQNSGHVFYQGKTAPVSEKERALMRNKFIGYVHQDYSVIPYENSLANVRIPLEYVKPKISRKNQNFAALEMLQKVNLATLARQKTARLSGGERQRVAIARAFANHPQLFLADEPTAALDSANAKQVLDLLSELSSTGTAALIATHDPRVSKRCDRVLVMEDGRLVS